MQAAGLPGRVKSSVKELGWSAAQCRADRLSVYVTLGVGLQRRTSLTVDFLAKLCADFADDDRSEHCSIIDARSAEQSHTHTHHSVTPLQCR